MDYRLVYPAYPLVLEGYTNANWINNTEDNSSTSGWVFLLGGGAISWAFKKQTCIIGSTMESKFMALTAAGKETEWLKNLLLGIPLWVNPMASISINCDSAATLAKVYSQIYNEKSRHLGVRHSMIREIITNGVVSIEFRAEANVLQIIPRMCLELAGKEDEVVNFSMVNMDDPNITMEEYIMFEEEKARKREKVFNWETAKYGKIWYDEDVHDLISIETEFPAIVLNDNLTSDKTLSCEPIVSSLNDNEIDFRISFDEFDDEDYTGFFDKNLFSYKIISANDLKTDSENDNEKANMPLFPSPEPSVSCIDDLDFFKYFKNEFPAIVYNDALTSKSDFSIEPTLCPQHIDEFNLKDETSMSECDKRNKTFYTLMIYFLLTTIDTANSLNEYSVFDTGFNTMYPRRALQGIHPIRRIPHRPYELKSKEGDNGYGWAIAKSIAPTGAQILVGTWVSIGYES
nr:zinc finger, CCHC-type [Tanacetum cinerariifolium]